MNQQWPVTHMTSQHLISIQSNQVSLDTIKSRPTFGPRFARMNPTMESDCRSRQTYKKANYSVIKVHKHWNDIRLTVFAIDTWGKASSPTVKRVHRKETKQEQLSVFCQKKIPVLSVESTEIMTALNITVVIVLLKCVSVSGSCDPVQ